MRDKTQLNLIAAPSPRRRRVAMRRRRAASRHRMPTGASKWASIPSRALPDRASMRFSSNLSRIKSHRPSSPCNGQNAAGGRAMRFSNNLSRIKSHRPSQLVDGRDDRGRQAMRFRGDLSRIKSHQPSNLIVGRDGEGQ